LKIRHSDNNHVAWKQNDQQYQPLFRQVIPAEALSDTVRRLEPSPT